MNGVTVDAIKESWKIFASALLSFKSLLQQYTCPATKVLATDTLSTAVQTNALTQANKDVSATQGSTGEAPKTRPKGLPRSSSQSQKNLVSVAALLYGKFLQSGKFL